MQIRFTRHAEEKFATLERHGMNVYRDHVVDAIERPGHLDMVSRAPLCIAQVDLDMEHVLRVQSKQALLIQVANLNMKTKNTMLVRYDSDADVLSIKGSSSTPIDYAREIVNVVVHFDKENEPVLIEVLDASHQLRGQTDALTRVVALAGQT